jgi:hypothetical protein
MDPVTPELDTCLSWTSNEVNLRELRDWLLMRRIDRLETGQKRGRITTCFS